MTVSVARSLRLAAAALGGYACGLFPTADLVARRHGVDLREAGTGNPGAANAAGQLGATAGLEVMAGDIAKAVVAGRVGRVAAGDLGVHVGATAAVIGHCHPVTHPGRGGKGVAASVGQVLVSFPVYFPIDAAVAVATAALPVWRQRAFAATVAASTVWVGASTLWWRRGWNNAWGPEPSAALPIAAAVSSAVIAERFVAAERAGRTAG